MIFMKPIIALTALLALGCSKANKKPNLEKYEGRWELIRYVGFGIPDHTLSAGNGNTIFLGDDGVYQRREEGRLVFEGTYSIQHKTNCDLKSDYLRTSEPSSDLESSIRVQSDTLTIFSSPCLMDGGGGVYRRL